MNEGAAVMHRVVVPVQPDLVCHHLSVYMTLCGAAAKGAPKSPQILWGLSFLLCL